MAHVPADRASLIDRCNPSEGSGRQVAATGPSNTSVVEVWPMGTEARQEECRQYRGQRPSPATR